MILTTIGRGFQLDKPAAESFKRVLAIRPGMLRLVNSAHRSYASQLRLRTAWLVYRQVFAMRPGTSVHNKGRALDIDSNPATADHAWMVAHGREHGWIRTNPAEPWHFEYVAALDQHRGDRLAAVAPITTQEEPMYYVTGDKSPAVFKVGPDGECEALGSDAYKGLSKTPSFALTKMPQAECDAIVAHQLKVRTQLARPSGDVTVTSHEIDLGPVLAAMDKFTTQTYTVQPN